jgi:hypothetical protein
MLIKYMRLLVVCLLLALIFTPTILAQTQHSAAYEKCKSACKETAAKAKNVCSGKAAAERKTCEKAAREAYRKCKQGCPE